MFYQTYGFGAGDSICHAVSDDGINFEKNAGNPIFGPTKDWCCGRAIDADVCIFNNKLFLYTATRDHAYAVQKIAAACAPLTENGYGFGDFKQICACSVLFPEMKWEQNCIEAPATIVDNGKIYMFYGGAYNCSPRQIGCAVSSDGRTFDKLFCEKPFIANGKEGDFNASESGHPFVFRGTDGKVWLYYQGSLDGGQNRYLSRMEIAYDSNGIPYQFR